MVPSIQHSHALSPQAVPSPCTDSQNRSCLEAHPGGPVACGCAEICLSPGVCCWAEAEVGLALQGRADTWQEAGSRAGAQLPCSWAQTEPRQEPQWGTHHGSKPHGVRAAREGLGYGASGSALSQTHRVLWLVASGQKAPQQGRRVFLAGSFLADFHLEVTFLWQ